MQFEMRQQPAPFGISEMGARPREEGLIREEVVSFRRM
jgi:hypothetical protein